MAARTLVLPVKRLPCGQFPKSRFHDHDTVFGRSSRTSHRRRHLAHVDLFPTRRQLSLRCSLIALNVNSDSPWADTGNVRNLVQIYPDVVAAAPRNLNGLASVNCSATSPENTSPFCMMSFLTGAPGLRLSFASETQKVLGRVAESK